MNYELRVMSCTQIHHTSLNTYYLQQHTTPNTYHITPNTKFKFAIPAGSFFPTIFGRLCH